MTTAGDYKIIDMNVPEVDIRLFHLFVQSKDAVEKYADAVLCPAGLSVSKVKVLHALYKNGGTMKPSEIAVWTLRSPHNITTLIRRLQREGLITVSVNSVDKRSIKVTLTDKGRDAVRESFPLAANIIKQVMSSVSESQIAELGSFLKVIGENACEGLKVLNNRLKFRRSRGGGTASLRQTKQTRAARG